MGRTKRKRNRKQKKKCPGVDNSDVNALQSSLKLKFKNLKIGYFRMTGRGLMCRKTFKEGDVIISLPLDVLITPNSPNEILPLLKTWDDQPQLDLSVLLVYETHLNKESKLFQYIQTLPKTYTNLYFATDDEIKSLPKFLRQLVVAQRENITNTYKLLMKSLSGLTCLHCDRLFSNIFTRNIFDWAWFTVNTRSVYYQDEADQKKFMALAPFLDLLNHSNDAKTEMTIDHKEKLYILKTMREMKKCTEAVIKYGTHSNLTLLLEYGFIIPDNPYDCVEFTFEEVLAGAKEFRFEYGNMTKFKYNFIIANKLNKNLHKNHEGFSWHVNALLQTLISQDDSLHKTAYSGLFDGTEQVILNRIGNIIVNKKRNQFLEDLYRMNKIQDCTESFHLSKQLISAYINLLQRNLC